jgi:hypothetical protein
MNPSQTKEDIDGFEISTIVPNKSLTNLMLLNQKNFIKRMNTIKLKKNIMTCLNLELKLILQSKKLKN